MSFKYCRIITITFFFLFSFYSPNAQVGVGTTSPDAELDIVSTAATDETLQVNHENATNPDTSLLVRNLGLGRSLLLQSLNTLNDIPAFQISQFGTAVNARGLDVIMDGASQAEGIVILNQGTASAIVGQNNSNTLPATIAVADFAYTGTDVDDHIGVSGFSAPAAGWGIGVLGGGDWYGVFSIGDFGATGTKTFAIDHPKDPANKILKHFSIESNEVLNMYRGTAVFDANGRTSINLPDYYDSINKNPSYQLTPIGAAMPNLYIEKEVSNGEFIIAGGIPNKKVSWQITAERNDPYLQQNPEKRDVVVEKRGSRKGKYLIPELYGKSKETGMNYRKNNKASLSSTVGDGQIKSIQKQQDHKKE